MIRAIYARLEAHPDHFRILRALLAIGALAGVAKLVGAAKEVLVAARYGTRPEVDAYVLLFNLLSWPTAVWAGVASTVVIPLLVRADLAAPADAMRFRRELLGGCLIAGAALGVIAAGALTWSAAEGWIAASADVAAAAAVQAPVLALILPLGLIFSLFAAFLIAERHVANNLLEATPSLAIIIALSLTAVPGPEPLVWATVIGFALQAALAVVLQPSRRRVTRPEFAFQSPLWRTIFASAGVVALGHAVTGSAGLLDQLVAARLGDGANATLSYATRVTSLFLTLGALAVTRATLPVFARLGIEDPRRQRTTARQWSRAMGAAGVAAVVVGWTAAPMMVRLLFERGAFTGEDTRVVTETLRFSLLQLPFYFSSIVLVQQLASNGAYSAFLKIGLVNVAAKAAALAVLVPLMGIQGVALSTAVMYGVGRLVVGRLARAPAG